MSAHALIPSEPIFILIEAASKCKQALYTENWLEASKMAEAAECASRQIRDSADNLHRKFMASQDK